MTHLLLTVPLALLTLALVAYAVRTAWLDHLERNSE